MHAAAAVPAAKSKPPAFTLVETVLAVGVLAVVVLGISGALLSAVSASGENDRDTLIVSMSEQVLSELRLAPFDALALKNPTESQTAAAPLMRVSAEPKNSVYYFNNDGQRVSAEQQAAEAVYRCTVRKQPLNPASGAAATAGPTDPRCDLLQVTLMFRTPVTGPETAATTRLISTRLARR